MSEGPLDSPITGQQPLRDTVYLRLRTAIIEGHMKPGERLVETKLAERLAVSRNPVREALRRLEQEQLVCSSGQGLVVCPITPTKVEEVYAIRAVLEGLCSSLAAQHMTPQQSEQLQTIVESTRQSLEKNDIAGITSCSGAFHSLMLEASGSATLRSLLSQVQDSVLRFRYATIPLEGRAEEILREHTEIMEAVVAHDAERAEAITRHHILAAGRRLVKSLENGEAA